MTRRTERFRHCRLQVSRLEIHVGRLAFSVWSSAFCVAGNGELRVNGAEICSTEAEPPANVHEKLTCFWRMTTQIRHRERIRQAWEQPKSLKNIGTPYRIRTCDLRLRRPVLYPTELRAHCDCVELYGGILLSQRFYRLVLPNAEVMNSI